MYFDWVYNIKRKELVVNFKFDHNILALLFFIVVIFSMLGWMSYDYYKGDKKKVK